MRSPMEDVWEMRNALTRLKRVLVSGVGEEDEASSEPSESSSAVTCAAPAPSKVRESARALQRALERLGVVLDSIRQ